MKFNRLPLVVLGLALSSAGYAIDFNPPKPEELALKSLSEAPGAHAVILEYDDEKDDNNSWENEYYRLKIFDEEGKKYADIELPYVRGVNEVNEIKARVIQPDGNVVPFDGKIYDKLIVKSKGVKVQAKTFSLPDVRPGSIIEYKFHRSWGDYVYSTRWTLQRNLFMKKASYSLTPYSRLGILWTVLGLPAGSKAEHKNGKVVLAVENMAAFDDEAFSPPEDQLKPRVEFFYSARDVKETPEEFWERIGKESHENVEDFIGNRKAIAEAVQQIVLPQEDPETKLRKIYARVQQMRNLSYERDKTEQEEKREKLKDRNNVEDVWKRGYGYRRELNRVFVAMARAAGFPTSVVLVSRRDSVFFERNLKDSSQLNGELAVVQAGGKEYYLDPGTPHCPFNLLSWYKTGVTGLKLNKQGGEFIITPRPDISKAVTKRMVTLRYEDGVFKGKATVMYTGFEALDRRLNALTDDEKEYKDNLEDEVKRSLPGGSTVKLTGIENAKGTEEPLIVGYDVEVPDFASSVGSRRLVPLALFQLNDANPFRHEKRVHPVYYSYPYQEVDQVTLELPSGFGIESVPAARLEQPPFGHYDTKWGQTGNSVTLTRRFAITGLLFPLESYSQLRDFYSKAATGDQDNAVLRTRPTSANK